MVTDNNNWTGSIINSTYALTSGLLDRLVETKKIRVKTHPVYSNLKLYKYRAGYDFFDDSDAPIVRHCRGLVFDQKTDRIICRPMPKFFNHFNYREDYLQELFSTMNYEVQEKVDGSCVNLWHYDGEWHTSTLGSFESEQAYIAQAIIKAKFDLSKLLHYCTYVFEVVYPKNRIVMNYGKTKDVRFLMHFDRDNGMELDVLKGLHGTELLQHKAKTANEFCAIQGDTMSFEELLKFVDQNETDEGFVVSFTPKHSFFNAGFRLRVKFKTKWYLERSRMKMMLHKDSFIRAVAGFYRLHEVLPDLPELQDKIADVHDAVETLYNVVDGASAGLESAFNNRKDQALEIHKLDVPKPIKAALFNALDSKTASLRNNVWKAIEFCTMDNLADTVKHIVNELENR